VTHGHPNGQNPGRPSTEAMLEVDGFQKRYGDVLAVEGSSFSVAPGEVFGLVGPNGAGKTTTLQAVVGLIDPTAGTVTVDGRPPTDPAVRSQVGWLPENTALYEEMTATAYLRFFADLYDVPAAVAADRIAATLDRLDLSERHRRLGDCSKGMQRKVAMARALVNDPALVVFDEPASGLDPLTTREVVSVTKELADRGKAVLFSAHDLHHVETVCDRVAVMHEGRVAAQGALEEIRAAHGGPTYHVYVDVALPDATADGDRYRIDLEDVDRIAAVRRRVAEAGGTVLDVRSSEPSLEDVFVSVTG